jgi:hypothetical protein
MAGERQRNYWSRKVNIFLCHFVSAITACQVLEKLYYSGEEETCLQESDEEEDLTKKRPAHNKSRWGEDCRILLLRR